MHTPFYFYPLFKFSVPEEIKNACFKDSTLISFNVVKMFGAFHFRGPTEGFADLSGHSNASDLPTSTLDSCKPALVWRWCCFAKQMPTWSHRYFCGSIRLSCGCSLGFKLFWVSVRSSLWASSSPSCTSAIPREVVVTAGERMGKCDISTLNQLKLLCS